jgi:hypothetical protein
MALAARRQVLAVGCATRWLTARAPAARWSARALAPCDAVRAREGACSTHSC